MLASGQRRLVELARALAGDFQILLLDEPSAGLDPAETASFGDVLRAVVTEDRRGILLVEHDMSLVRSVCEHAYVLDFGKLIDQGPIAHVLSRAYLSNPSYVFLDEVSLGLAPRIVDEIFAFLRRLADLGSALLLVEQYITRALAIADFVFIWTRAGSPSPANLVSSMRKRSSEPTWAPRSAERGRAR